MGVERVNSGIYHSHLSLAQSRIGWLLVCDFVKDTQPASISSFMKYGDSLSKVFGIASEKLKTLTKH